MAKMSNEAIIVATKFGNFTPYRARADTLFIFRSLLLDVAVLKTIPMTKCTVLLKRLFNAYFVSKPFGDEILFRCSSFAPPSVGTYSTVQPPLRVK